MANQLSSSEHLAFIDLQVQYATNKKEIDAAIQRVLDHGQYIMGPEVEALESALGDFVDVHHVVGCSSGTDALLMILMAEGIGSGDAVFVPSFTFTATAEALLLLGIQPVFVDVDPDDFNMSLEDLERRIDAVKIAGQFIPRGIIAVDLFGLPIEYTALQAIADRHDLRVWGDAAQSFGGSVGSKKVGSLFRATATSFFPAKPFGCYGDGGAIFTDDDGLARILRSIRVHGMGDTKYDIVRTGLNARLDTIQAAILLAKLPNFAVELEQREAVAQKYDALLSGVVQVPLRRQGRSSTWAQYTIKVDADRRDEISASLKQAGVPTAVYYPRPMHLQTAYYELGEGEGSLPISEALSHEVLSLPMHPFLTDEQIEQVTDALIAAISA
ncbi:MAG: DegT/DnrJ/EryC1/StrS family aminotransferase [Alphaproteobacteria bacterium]|nr:DegT/DnrJ/EryC1/StrS family aminotransferase [Alphaproteobacteria bacterium]